MEQNILLSGLFLRKGQRFGSLQHAPQLTHCPLRFSETGNRHVKVLLVLARHVFLFLLVITLNFNSPHVQDNIRPVDEKQCDGHDPGH